MKHLITILTALLFATAANAQTTLGPGDVGADWSNPVTSGWDTGTAPADAYEPAEIGPQGFTESDWIDTTDNYTTTRGGGNFLVTGDGTAEKKFRTTCEHTGKVLPEDFIRGGVSHLHGAYGLQAWNGSSTYATARFNPSSSCPGGPLFSQIYIQPQLLTTDAKTSATLGVREQDISVYYINGAQNEPNEDTWVRRDFQMFIGPDPMNYNDTARRAIYSSAGLAYPGSPETPAGFLGYYCILSDGTNVSVPLTKAQLQTPNGTHFTNYAKYFWGSGANDDPFDGQCKAKNGLPATLVGNLLAPQCWDGYNLKRPKGNEHVWFGASSNGNPPFSCPRTTGGVAYRKLPEPTFKFQILVNGPADYKNLYYSSDRMKMATTECPDANAPCDGTSGGNVPGTVSGVFYSRVSLDECRRVSVNFCGGSTLHADWGYGVDSKNFDIMMRECLSIPVRGIAPQYASGAECNAATFARYKTFRYGPSLNTALTAGCAVIGQCYDSTPAKPKEYFLTVPKQPSGSTKVHRM